MASLLSSVINTFVTATTSLIFAPFILALSLLLFPFAVFTTYFAIVALAIRALLVYIELFIALLRQHLGLDDPSYSSWAAAQRGAELRHAEKRRESFKAQQTKLSIATASINGRTLLQTESPDAEASLVHNTNEAATPRANSPLKPSSTHSPTSSGSSTISQPPSPPNPRSCHRQLPSRDYESVGGWYALDKPSAPPFQLIETNTRLELPEADPLSLARPRTPEESVGSRSRSNSYTRRDRAGVTDLTSPVGPYERRGSSSSLRARAPPDFPRLEDGETSVVTQRSRANRPRSMILPGEKGGRVTFDLDTAKTPTTARSVQVEIENDGGDEAAEENSAKRRKKIQREDGDAGNSETSSLDSAEGGLTMKMP